MVLNQNQHFQLQPVHQIKLLPLQLQGQPLAGIFPEKQLFRICNPNFSAAELRSSPSERKVFDIFKLASELIETIKLKIQGQSASSSMIAIETFPPARSTATFDTQPISTNQPSNQASGISSSTHQQPPAETTQTNSLSMSIPKEAGLEGIALSSDGQFVATVNDSNSVEIWQVRSDNTMKRLRQLEATPIKNLRIPKQGSIRPGSRKKFTSFLSASIIRNCWE